MAVIKLTNLGGLEPSVLPRNLPANGAQVANNLNPGTAEFRPLLNDAEVATVEHASPQVLYRFDRKADGSLNTDESQGWKSSPALIQIVRQQLNDDTTGKIFYAFADGSAPMRWHNAAGEDRQVGVPAPTTAPNIVSVNDGYVFTSDVRTFELTAVLDQAVQIVRNNVAPAWAGIDDPLPLGWVRRSAFVSPSDPRFDAFQREVVRAFAVDPTTNAVINTFSDMPVDESSWVFDATLGGYYFTAVGGEPLPAWASGHTKFWCINLRAFAQVFDIDPVAIKAGLMGLKMPGTQGATPLLTSAEADAIIARLVDHGDKDGMRVATKIAALRSKVLDVAEMFAVGGRASLDAQTEDFYQRSDVQATLGNARTDFAEAIWGYVQMIGKATATPFYYSPGDTGA